MTWLSEIGVWVAAILTLCLYSFLYRDNPFYKFAEHLFVGVAQGYWTVRVYFEGFLPYVWVPLRTTFGIGEEAARPFEIIILIPIVLGLMFFGRFFRGYHWITRIPLAFVFGAASGIAIPLVFGAQIFQQAHATVAPFGSASGWGMVNLILITAGTLAGLTYFFFSVEHRGAVGWVSRVGIWFLMIGFGSAFGNTVMNRVMLLIQRVEFLLMDWLNPYVLQRVLTLFGGGQS